MIHGSHPEHSEVQNPFRAELFASGFGSPVLSAAQYTLGALGLRGHTCRDPHPAIDATRYLAWTPLLETHTHSVSALEKKTKENNDKPELSKCPRECDLSHHGAISYTSLFKDSGSR